MHLGRLEEMNAGGKVLGLGLWEGQKHDSAPVKTPQIAHVDGDESSMGRIQF